MANAFDSAGRELLSNSARNLQNTAFTIARERIGPYASEVDAAGKWPRHSFNALSEGGLMGLTAPKEVGGWGEGLLALAAVTEAIGESCSSSAICFGMHCVGTAVIAAKPTPYLVDKFLKPIAQGKHITTLALSERGTGSQFWISESTLARQNGNFVVNAQKQFVTNGGEADSYVLSTRATREDAKGLFNMLLLEKGQPGMRWPSAWDGFGMRGNSSLGLSLENVQLPLGNLLGEEGDEIWFVFEIVAPFFLVAMAGTYLGIAQAAFDIALAHIKGRRYSHSPESLQDNPVIQSDLAEIWITIQRFRTMLYAACIAGDKGTPEALTHIFAAKAEAAETCVSVCNRAMTLCGGTGYRENGKLGRLLRDARAADVMAPTTHILKQWTGRSLLGIELVS